MLLIFMPFYVGACTGTSCRNIITAFYKTSPTLFIGRNYNHRKTQNNMHAFTENRTPAKKVICSYRACIHISSACQKKHVCLA